MTPKLIIHGGAGLVESPDFTEKEYDRALKRIVKESYQVLVKMGARAGVLCGIRLMEDNPLFNAGYGSRLQRDGEVRMSAAMMDSETGKFAGVINIRNVRHPIDVVDHLSKARHSVLSGEKATEYARRKKIAYFSPMAPHRLKEHIEKLKGETGTVGAVAIDRKGIICAGTSTGGIGYETPGRVSDSGTVAGTYASYACGVSCTGRGEQIVNYAVAARVVSFVESGIPIHDAIKKVMKQAKTGKLRMGLIALDHHGEICVGDGHGMNVLFAQHDSKKVQSFFKR